MNKEFIGNFPNTILWLQQTVRSSCSSYFKLCINMSSWAMDGPANGPLSFTPLQSVSSVAQLAVKQFRNTSRSQEVGVRRPGGRRQESGGWQLREKIGTESSWWCAGYCILYNHWLNSYHLIGNILD